MSGTRYPLFVGALLLLSLALYSTGAFIEEGPFAPPPSGYVHRPILEYFTGLSCPSCMGDSPDADSPEKAVHDLYKEARADPSEPFTTVVFHQLNGGGEDSLRTEEGEQRMRFYQPGISGTPDVEIDGGYTTIGGFSTNPTPITKSSVESALTDASTRYNDKPLRPLERLTWSFPYLSMEVREIFNPDGSFYIEVKASYLGNAKSVGAPALRGTLYVFMVEDNVTAKSKVYENKGIENPYIRNDAVFRGYAVRDETFTLSAREDYLYSGTWSIPDAEVRIKPQDVYAVAAIYDTSDTSSGGSNANIKANSPRCVQSATSRSTAYDLENQRSSVSSLSYENGEVQVVMEDDHGIAEAYLFYTTEVPELPEVPIWTPVKLTISGEELCDDQGICYAYSDPVGTATIDPGVDPIMMQVLMYDDQGISSPSEVYSIGDPGSATDKGSIIGLQFNLPTIVLGIGLVLLVIGPALFVLGRKKKVFYSSKAALAIFISLGLILAMISLSSMAKSDTDKVPDFSVRDTKGGTHTPELYSGKVLVLNMMFVDCSFCQKEMPDLVRVYEDVKQRYGSDVEFLSVSIQKSDSDQALDDFQNTYGARWPIGRDPSFMQKFDAFSVPKMVIIAPNGEIAYTHKGVIDPNDVTKAIDNAVSGDYRAQTLGQRSTSFLMLLPLAAGFGILTFFSPCSFPMLPGYLTYYVAQDLKKGEKKASPVKGGLFAASGIIAFFLLIGIFVAIFGAVVQSYLYSLMPVVGGILLILGLSIILGFDSYLERMVEIVKRPFTKIGEALGAKTSTEGGVGSLFAYGFGYGAAASSCMAPIFIAVMLLGFSTGLIGGGVIFLVYALSLGAMMVFVSLMVSSSEGLITKLISSMDTIKKVSGGLLILTGAFVIWYFFWGYRLFSGILNF